MRGFCLALVCLLSLGLMLLPAPALGDETPVLRALIVTCDRFLSGEDTTPAAQINAQMMREALEADARGYAVIRTESDTVSSAQMLKDIVDETFADAKAGDISLIYLSTHGVYNPARSNRTACLLLSDGETEGRLYAGALEAMVHAVPGTHLIIMDACNSGAMIGKGLSDPADLVALNADTDHVLCSAGGSEQSWYWRSDTDGNSTLYGAGYFTSILARGLSAQAGYPADEDGDGTVTMGEAAAYLREHYAVSTPQVYPERDGQTVLFRCGPAEEGLTGFYDVEFEETVFSAGADAIRFSFELGSPTDIAYHLVYMKNGQWDFANAQQFSEPASLAPGSYERTLRLNLPDEDLTASGYIMLQVFVLNGGRPVLAESRLISVLPQTGDVALSVTSPSVFYAAGGAELPVTVRHDIPCVINVRVQNVRGETVRNLAFDLSTRPQRLVPEGTCLYWDGLTERGAPADSGYYIIRVATEIGQSSYTAYSMPFRLVRSDEAEG